MLELYYTQGGVVDGGGGGRGVGWGGRSPEPDNVGDKSLELLLSCMIIILVCLIFYSLTLLESVQD